MGAEQFFGPPPGVADVVLGRIGAAIHELVIDLYSIGSPEHDRIAEVFEKFANLIERS